MTDVDAREVDRAQALLADLRDVLEQAGERLRALLGESPAPAAAALHSAGGHWTFTYGGRELLLRDTRGLQHLSRLLARPNEPVHVLELVGAVPEPRGGPGQHAQARSEGDAEPALDDAARAARRRQLARLQHQPESEHGDLERRLREQELSRSAALHSRDRRLSDPVEPARVAVASAIRSAILAVGARDPAAGAHLAHSVHTGTFCRYVVDPVLPRQGLPGRD